MLDYKNADEGVKELRYPGVCYSNGCLYKIPILQYYAFSALACIPVSVRARPPSIFYTNSASLRW